MFYSYHIDVQLSHLYKGYLLTYLRHVKRKASCHCRSKWRHK